VHRPACELNGTFAAQLGCELTPAGDLKVSIPLNETSVSGVFAAGDCSTPMKAVMAALMTGGAASARLCAQLEMEGVKAESERQA
jgi:thioredoxin reductase